MITTPDMLRATTQTRKHASTPEPESHLEYEKLAADIERAVRSRVGRMVRELRVEASSAGVILHGVCSTFYTKQLAQHAAMSLVRHETFDNKICVE